MMTKSEMAWGILELLTNGPKTVSELVHVLHADEASPVAVDRLLLAMLDHTGLVACNTDVWPPQWRLAMRIEPFWNRPKWSDVKAEISERQSIDGYTINTMTHIPDEPDAPTVVTR